MGMRLLIVLLCAGVAGLSCFARGQGDDAARPQETSVQQGDAVARPACYPDERLYQWHVIYKDRPYSGIRVSTCEKRRSDGTTYKATRAEWEWRDSEGRLRVDTKERIPEDSKIHNVQVYDPVRHISWNWSEGKGADKTAVMVRYKASQDFVEPEINRRVLPDGTVDPPIMAHMANMNMPGQKQIILKPTNINGVWAEGERMIMKSFTGNPGSSPNRDEVRTEEFWFSVDLELEIRHLSDDPHQGKSTVNLLRIDRAEPDAALFRPPAGYEVMDATPKHPMPERNPFVVLPARPADSAGSPN